MDHRFEKESILIEWIPYSILVFFSLMFIVFAVTSDTIVMIIGSAIFAIIFASLPIFIFRYLQSFSAIGVNGHVIKVFQKDRCVDFSIPQDLRRVTIFADDLQIELMKKNHRFVLRTHFLRNNARFHSIFSEIIKNNPPSEDKVILKASVIDMMERLG